MPILSLTRPHDPADPIFKACCFCKEENVTIGYDGQPATSFYAKCLSCGAQGPAQYSGGQSHGPEFINGVIRAWNKAHQRP